MASSDVDLWSPRNGALVPKNATTPEQITQYAKQLSSRERSQVIAAFSAGNYEMGSVFLWSRAMAGLKKQLAMLGMEFIGEMLDRADIIEDAPIAKVVTDHEALGLAEGLGIFNGTEALRLRHAMELVAHFSDPPEEDGDPQEMMPEEAVQVLRACIQGILGHERLDGAVEFARFRRELETRIFKADDDEIEQLVSSPYFFRRTTLRVLLALVKVAASAQLENAIANFELLLPLLWEALLKPERWLVGRAYAEVHAAGKRTVAVAIRRALMKVHGFDFVPEDLRSRTFITSARRVQEVHFGTDNFHNEPVAIRALASLGTSIPMPAFPTCITATLCVCLGNPYGYSWAAQSAVKEILDRLSRQQWLYYLDECLRGDDTILSKLANEGQMLSRWIDVVAAYELGDITPSNPNVKKFVEHCAKKDSSKSAAVARALYTTLRDKNPAG
jgi:hypothetical protein